MSGRLTADRHEWDALPLVVRSEYREAVLAELRQAGRTTSIGMANRLGGHYRANLVRECLRELERGGEARIVTTVRYHDHEIAVYEVRT
jgi:hypothetical protein